jgi:carbon monoxide dehydrogenase subunit G
MGIKGVKLSLKINKKTYKATTNNKGVAKFKVKLPKVKKTYKVKVKFAGNKANNKKTLSTKVKVY